jgi:hypothetical protein
LCYEELHDLYSSPDIIQIMKLRKITWVGHVAHVGGRGERNICRVLMGKPEGMNHLEDLDISGKRILKYVLKTWVKRV